MTAIQVGTLICLGVVRSRPLRWVDWVKSTEFPLGEHRVPLDEHWNNIFLTASGSRLGRFWDAS